MTFGVWRDLGGILGASGGHLGGILGASWVHLGGILKASWACHVPEPAQDGFRDAAKKDFGRILGGQMPSCWQPSGVIFKMLFRSLAQSVFFFRVASLWLPLASFFAVLGALGVNFHEKADAT